MVFVGREEELQIIQQALQSKRPELLAIYGRRRIGKTYLVRTFCAKYLVFEFSGAYKTPYKIQLGNFDRVLQSKRGKYLPPTNWFEAFAQLEKYLSSLTRKSKKVVFLDEFPWADTHRSQFLRAFEYFWNTYASKQEDVVVIICGSSASYMVQKILNNKGGLHNRLTERIALKSFTLRETKQFLEAKKIKLTNYDILQLYMVIGGVPFYLDKLTRGESVPQAINRLCFSKDGFLRREFNNIFISLFEQSENHEAVVRALAAVRKGIRRNEIQSKTKIASGGTLTSTLRQLEESGFIEQYVPIFSTKDALYRLTDEYSLFYLRFIENSRPSKGAWLRLQTKPIYKIWSGFCFESICIKHIETIKEALGIQAIYSTQGNWIKKGKVQGAQIDLLIDRDDNVINLCEMKFYNGPYALDKKSAENLRDKLSLFQRETKTTKNIFITLITTYGVKETKYSKELVHQYLDVGDLF